MGLVGALTAHYGSPGRLADYRRQFERTIRTAREDPSIFAIALETLAVKAFGDMSHTTRLVVLPAVAGAASPADLAEVDAADVTSLADAGMLFSADLLVLSP